MKTKTRGIESIVAAALLIVVAVIGAVLIYLWFAGYVTKASSQAEQSAVSEKLKIEAANLTNRGGALFIRNLGGVNATISTIYILKPGSINPLCTADSFTIYRGTSTTTGSVGTLYPERLQLVKFTVSVNCGIRGGNEFVIKVVTQKGTEFAVTVTAS